MFITQRAEPNMMPGIRRQSLKLLHTPNLGLQIGNFSSNQLNTCSSPRDKLRCGSSDAVMKGVHRGGAINRAKSIRNTSIAIIIIKPKVIKMKDAILRGDIRLSSKKNGRMIKARMREMLNDNRDEVYHPVLVGQISVQASPTTSQA